VTFPNDYGLGNNFQNSPLTVFATKTPAGNQVFVADGLANRVVRYASPPNSGSPSPRIDGVIGQADLFSGKVNRGQIEPDSATLSSPGGGALDSGGNLWIVDTNNNRVLSYPEDVNFNFPLTPRI
jgi:sugar lactone lactonase YvrE